MNLYEIRARYVPAIITALPMIVFSGFVKEEIWISVFRNIGWFLVVENISFSMITVVFLIHAQRGIAKHMFEERIFDSGKKFPATRMLLLSDTHLSETMKMKVREKIKKDFGITLRTKDDEQDNMDEARKSIRDAVGLIRKQVGDGDKTLQYNIHYGFTRNLIGGATFSVPCALICTIFSALQKNVPVLIVSIAMLTGFALIIMMSRSIMTHFGNVYAECLLTEYLTTKQGE